MRVVPMPCRAGSALAISASSSLAAVIRCSESRARLAAAERLAVEVDQARRSTVERRDVAAGVAAHAVGHREQARPGIPGVLVAPNGPCPTSERAA